ncbi:MAG: class III signal peptide-containing protein [Candidatus Diapherotrites archaeon]
MKFSKAQGSMEYLLLIAGALLVVAILIAIMANLGGFGKSTSETGEDKIISAYDDFGGDIFPELKDLCDGVTCTGNYCGAGVNTLYYDGECNPLDGFCHYEDMDCDYGCEDGECKSEPDLCETVVCENECDVDNNQKYNGVCNPVDGSCDYDTKECVIGCTDGLCNEDPCQGVVCDPDQCINTDDRKYDGICNNAICTYSTENCEFGCENALCNPDPCDGVICEDGCKDESTKNINGVCYSETGVPVCEYTEVNCIFGCESGTCKGDPCEGISCEPYCDNETRYFTGSCSDGSCDYASSEVCEFGCAPTKCLDEIPCTEDWDCSGWSSWSAWSTCVNSEQSRTRTRTCTDNNDCGTETEKPAESEIEYQSCGTNYKERTEYLNLISGGYEKLSVGEKREFLLLKDAPRVFVLDMVYGVEYKQTVVGYGGGTITNEERYAPPAMQFFNDGGGILRYTGGPEVTGGDVQRMAVKIATTSSSPFLVSIKIIEN